MDVRLGIVVAAVLVACLPPSLTAASTCPVTPAVTAPPPLLAGIRTSSFMGWTGTDALATRVPANGRLFLLPRGPGGYRHKMMYWGRDIAHGREGTLGVHAVHVDTGAAVDVTDTGDGVGDHGVRFLNAVLEFPVAGCWTVTATFRGETLTHTLFVDATL